MINLKLASKLFNKPIQVPNNVIVTQHFHNDLYRIFSFKGPLGTLTFQLPNNLIHYFDIIIDSNGRITAFSISKCSSFAYKSLNISSFVGLTYKLISNIITGITRGYHKKLRIFGTGYRVTIKSNTNKSNIKNQSFSSSLYFKLGFSHLIVFPVPPTVSIKCPNNTTISIFGIDLHQVTLVTSLIRSLRLPDVYKAKGIRFAAQNQLKLKTPAKAS
jgi:ribosomal protein L6P/L9E